jgi:hypothetical protein
VFTTPKSLSLSLIAIALALACPMASAANPKAANHPLCKNIAQGKIQASAAAQSFCFGAQPNAPVRQITTLAAASGTAMFRPNVNAASLAEDVSPGGARAFGQSETSIASSGSYVVEAWNDSTGFFSPCPSPMHKEQLTGFGFSNNGGNSFKDMGGTPVADCTTTINEGDPAVEAYTVGGKTYFYISQITIPFNIPENGIGLNACQVLGSGSTATLSCNNTILAAVSSDCLEGLFCSFLDKDFITIDPGRKRLYISYTEFGADLISPAGQVEVAMCDISNPMAPICSNGSVGSQSPPYIVVAKGDPNCESEGSYPGVDRTTGDVYVGFEFNWATNILNVAACGSVPTKEVVTRLAKSCLPGSGSSPCSPPFTHNSVKIISMDSAFIPGYNRFPMNDYPRIAVSRPKNSVSLVWNDAGNNPLGNILLQSFALGSLTKIQSKPVALNSDVGAFNWHFLPAVRQASGTGLINVSWYDRRNNPGTALTDVFSALNVDPTTKVTPPNNFQVNDAVSNWLAVSSDIVPNFGDYTDNYLGSLGLFVAWSDGRIGEPQPFSARER